MRSDSSIVSDFSVIGVGVIFIALLTVLGVRLHEVQMESSSDLKYLGSRQSVRRVQTAGIRGRILDRNGTILADNRGCATIVLNPEDFQRRSWDMTAEAISNAIVRAGSVIGRGDMPDMKSIRRHISQRLAMPMVVWRDIDFAQLSRFAENEDELPGFKCVTTAERVYPQGMFAAHVLGYVGRDETPGDAGDESFHFRDKEMKGRAGIEYHYDEFLRGVPGEKRLVVDARGFTYEESTLVEPRRGPDLRLTLDVKVQRAVENQLRGVRGACAVIDPRNGEVLALASSPQYDPNSFVPILRQELYRRHVEDPAMPLLNRAVAGAYAPGSIFKPVVALAGLRAGYPEERECECTGVVEIGNMRLHCARRWGHGDIGMRHAIMQSCNPFFVNLGMDIGTNSVLGAARDFALGRKTGIDLDAERAGVVPDDEWKRNTYNEPWYSGDLAQISIGQGMLLTTPLQMARVTGAIATGYLTVPHLRAGAIVEKTPVPFSGHDLAIVRKGMEMVVNGSGRVAGTGRRGGEGVAVRVAGKTGTAEVGSRANRRKNAWFAAYAPADNPTVAVAMIVENGVSGGETAAPRVCEVLKAIFGEKQDG